MYDDKIKIALAEKAIEIVKWIHEVADKNVYWDDVEGYNNDCKTSRVDGRHFENALKVDVAKFAETKDYYKEHPRRTQLIFWHEYYVTTDNKIYNSSKLVYDNGKIVEKDFFNQRFCDLLIQLVLGWEEKYKREIKNMVCLDKELLAQINSVAINGTDRPKRKVIRIEE